MTKKVSVCIPSYNGAQFIGETIKSVLDSVHPNIELIINDDASTDGTLDVIESFNDGRISIYQNAQNLGVVANWNMAVTRATGDYVSLLNHDDLYGPLWLAFTVYQLEENPHVGWVATAHRITDAAGRSLRVISRFPVTGEIPRTEAFLEIAKLNGLGPGFVARREILEEMGYYDLDAGPQADNDLFLRLAARHALYYSSSYTHASARLHAHNLTHRWSHTDQVLQGARTVNKVFSDPSLSEELRGYRAICLNNFLSKAAVQAERTIATDT
jgi:glycosyltransferase involved in cell wall biosynthesis